MLHTPNPYFDDSPDPMWVHDIATHRFLDVNDAAVRTYGYSRDQFLEMTTRDLGPSGSDAAGPGHKADGDPEDTGLCLHRLTSGAVIDVDVTAREIDHRGGRAMLVVAHDVTRLMTQQRQAGVDAQHFRTIFESLPGMFVVVTGDRFLIMGASDAYVQATHLTRSDLIGCPLFVAFPEDANDSAIDGVRKLAESLRKVVASGIEDVMPVLAYPMRIPKDPKKFEIRYASVVNSPILADDGHVAFIIHRAEDVTEQIRLAESLGLDSSLLSEGDDPAARLALELMRRSEELKLANDHLQTKVADLREESELARIAGRVARVGGWRVELNPTRIHWSDEVAEIHDEAAGTFPQLDAALNYYPPEHREVIESAVSACMTHGTPYDQILQIVTARNRRIWVRATGEAELGKDGAITAMRGAFQDISDIIAARQASHATAERLEQILENMSDSFVVLDAEWRFVFLNAQAERTLLRGRGNLIGKVVWDEFPHGRGPAFQAEFERAVSTGQPVRFESYYPEPLNSWFEVSAHPTPEGLAVYFRDATEDHLKTEQLRLLELSVSHVNDMLLITEAEPLEAPYGPKIIFANDAMVRQTGYSREELIGTTPRIFQGEATDQVQLDRIRTALLERKSVRAELLNYTRDRDAYWVEVSVNPVLDDSGKMAHIVSVQRDITERKKAEAALRLSAERFRLVANTSQAVIWDWDIVDGSIWFNDNMKTLFGHPAGVCSSKDSTWRGRVHPDDFEDLDASLKAAIAGTAKGWDAKYRYFKGNGQHVLIQDRGFFIRDPDGKALRLVGSFRDVTAEHEREERLRQSQKLEAMGQLTGGVAHDFNNLLTVIIGTAEIIAESTSDPRHKHLAEMAIAAAERGAALTSRLLAFARKQPLRPAIVDVNALSVSVEGMLKRTLPENVELVLHLSKSPWMVELDANQFEVALLNLAINARDAMPRGGTLTIETANIYVDDAYVSAQSEVVPGPYVQVTVTDVGTGMTPEIIARAFEPFFTTKPEGVGSGLGLSLVYGFVKQSGGYINIYSEPGVGTAFRLYFPRTLSNVKISETIQIEDRLPGGHEKILVVEDDEFVREHLVGQLRAMGYQVVQAPDAQRGLDILAETPGFDMLLTDVIMPGGINGWQLSEMARDKVPGLKVLFTSGYSENALMHDGRLDPFVDLLNKPYRRQELAAKVRKVLDS